MITDVPDTAHLRHLPIIHLHPGDVIIDAAGEHTITRVDLSPPFMAAIYTDTGLQITAEWTDKTTYTVRV